jgi:uncharacterized protein YndB with AHSA1/START domain
MVEGVADRRIAYSWKGGGEANIGYGALDTAVTLTLEQVEDGTRLRMFHPGFQLPHTEMAYGNMSDGRIGVIARISEVTKEAA